MCAGLVRKVVGNLIKAILAPRGRSRQRPEACDAGDTYRRTDRIRWRRLQIAEHDLAARLVDRARVEGDDVADRDRLVAVIQSGGCARSVERSGPARIWAIHVVEAVAE